MCGLKGDVDLGGTEVGPSDKAACTQCRAGTFRPPGNNTDFCFECQAHTFAALPGATSCTNCEPLHLLQ